MGKEIKKLDLTDREIQVVKYLCKGLNAAKIGKLMNLSPRTIEHKILWARIKLGANNTTHLVAIYYEDKIKKMQIN